MFPSDLGLDGDASRCDNEGPRMLLRLMLRRIFRNGLKRFWTDVGSSAMTVATRSSLTTEPSTVVMSRVMMLQFIPCRGRSSVCDLREMKLSISKIKVS